MAINQNGYDNSTVNIVNKLSKYKFDNLLFWNMINTLPANKLIYISRKNEQLKRWTVMQK